MFSQQHNIPKQHYRVEHYPTVDELRKFLVQAESIRGVKHCFCWREQDAKKMFTLSILFAVKAGSDPEWWMHEETEFGPRMLWFYRSHDLSIIYPQVLQAVGAPLSDEDVKVDHGSLTDRLGAMSQKYATPGATGPAVAAAPPSNRPPIGKLLSGTLESRPISALLQTANQEAATGKLIIESPEMGEGTVHFMHGVPLHATTVNHSGVDALIELFAWQQGKVMFNQGTKPDTTTIHQTVEQILYRGAQLIENIAFLQEHNINEHSILRRVPAAITEKEFEKRILEGPPLGLDLQKSFFQNVDGNRTLQDIATFLSLAPSQWIAICVNLLRLGLLITPDGRSVQFQLQSQTLSGPMMQTAPGAPPIPPQGQFGRSSDHQAITGSFSRNPPPPGNGLQPTQGQMPPHMTNPSATTGNTSGSWMVPGSQSISGSFNSSGQSAGQNSGAPPMPPSSMFSGAPPAGATNAMQASPAVEAFLTASTTQEVDTVHVGIQSIEVRADRNAIKAVWSALCEKETGILTFEALQLFLEREVARSFRQGTGFALIVFSIKLRSENRRGMLASKMVAQIANAINKIKNDVDIFGHFGEKGYAIIVPNASGSQAASLVDKITTNLTKFAPDLAQNRPTFYFGIASIPNDAQDIDVLMSNAQKAMLEASKRNITRVQFSEI